MKQDVLKTANSRSGKPAIELITAVICKAIEDAKEPNLNGVGLFRYRKKYERRLKQEAKRFLNRDNWIFKGYCKILGINSEWLTNKLMEGRIINCR
jgi:hypothetical protein